MPEVENRIASIAELTFGRWGSIKDDFGGNFTREEKEEEQKIPKFINNGFCLKCFGNYTFCIIPCI